MKTIRHYFYSSSLILSGACMILMTLMILAQILAKTLESPIPSSDDYARWLLAATIFFGLAYTFNEGGHIRVTLLLSRLSGNIRKILEFVNLVLAILIVGALSWYLIRDVWGLYVESYPTDTHIKLPKWIVQTPVAIGSVFLFIAIIDSLFDMLRGKTPNYMLNEDQLDLDNEKIEIEEVK